MTEYCTHTDNKNRWFDLLLNLSDCDVKLCCHSACLWTHIQGVILDFSKSRATRLIYTVGPSSMLIACERSGCLPPGKFEGFFCFLFFFLKHM